MTTRYNKEAIRKTPAIEDYIISEFDMIEEEFSLKIKLKNKKTQSRLQIWKSSGFSSRYKKYEIVRKTRVMECIL